MRHLIAPKAVTEQQRTTSLKELDQPGQILPASAITNIIGVFTDIKPAAIVEENDLTTSQIHGLGLAHLPFNMRDGQCGNIVSKDSNLAERLSLLLQSSLHHRTTSGKLDMALEYQIGLALGYPKTATTYYLSNAHKGIIHNRRNYETKIDIETLAFCTLVLSKRHWRDEIDSYVTPLRQAVREYAPNTYRVMVSNAIADQALRNTTISTTF